MKRLIYSFIITLFFIQNLSAQEYNASKFGCISDGITNNTTAIQYAIDFISAKGGGKLNFYVGRYVTGSLQLKSNVTIELHEGAVLLASPNPNDYTPVKGERAFLIGDSVQHVHLTGKGVIEFQPQAMTSFIEKINKAGILSYAIEQQPASIALIHVEDVKVDSILISKNVNSAIKIIGGERITIENVAIKSAAAQSLGLTVDKARGVALKNIYVDVRNKAFTQTPGTEKVKAEKCITPNGKSIL